MNSVKLISQNKKAYHDYFLEETIECGIELVGTEVKSLRDGKVNIKDSYASIDNGEVYVKNMHISPYEKGNIFNRDPLRVKKLRERRLLLHKNEILRLFGKIKEKGYSLIPVKIYFKNSKVKVELALAKGKKNYDKRNDIAKKDAKRETDRRLRENQK